jgi:hypothetical protein
MIFRKNTGRQMVECLDQASASLAKPTGNKGKKATRSNRDSKR